MVSKHGHNLLRMGHYYMYGNLDMFHYLFQQDDVHHIAYQVLVLLLYQNPTLSLFLALLLS